MKERDTGVFGISGHVDDLADVQQSRVVHRHRQVGLDEARRRAVCFGGGTFILTASFTTGHIREALLVYDEEKIQEAPPKKDQRLV